MKVIFLDVDGVLNYSGAKARTPEGSYFVQNEKLAILRDMVDATGAQLVLSSSWRRGWEQMSGKIETKDVEFDSSRDYFMLCAKLHEFGLGLLSEIPRYVKKTREDEIESWIRQWPGEKIENYVILDDEKKGFLPDNPHLIVTSNYTGLQREDINEALRIFGISTEEIKKQILIVDDIKVNRAVLKETLQENYEIFEAENGQEALEILEQNEKMSLVITDLQMPEMDGMTLIKKIRSNIRYAHIAIIANTQYGDMKQEEDIIEAGADDFVYKPSTQKIILLRVKNVLKLIK